MEQHTRKPVDEMVAKAKKAEDGRYLEEVKITISHSGVSTNGFKLMTSSLCNDFIPIEMIRFVLIFTQF